ncbi:hypothetical protein TNCV_291411 [Trichonephila clavipes]|nr:hypothetical protein TNCV_291411 [Trichonephila clavipes]
MIENWVASVESLRTTAVLWTVSTLAITSASQDNAGYKVMVTLVHRKAKLGTGVAESRASCFSYSDGHIRVWRRNSLAEVIGIWLVEKRSARTISNSTLLFQ